MSAALHGVHKMATYTTNYNLKKPATTDYVAIGDLNDNFDKIDTKLKSLDSNKLGTTDTAYGATRDGSGNVIADTYQEVNLVFTSKTCSTWASDSTYSDFAYKGTIVLSGVTASDVAEVVFSPDDALSGDFAPVCQTYAGGVYIWSTGNSSVTVPLILVHKG